MPSNRLLLIPAIACLLIGPISAVPQPAAAAEFGQQAVDQSKFVAIAVPYNNGADYKLLIVEQLADTQPCWAIEPTTGSIDPLLLKFDFTKICARSTDSNGYSIRRAGQDLWQDYGLRLVKQDNYLALMGVAHRNPTGPKIEIGRTRDLQPGFLQVQLNPGWQFAKRTYNGKVLGHVYLAQDQPQSPDSDVQVASQPQAPSSVARGSQPTGSTAARRVPPNSAGINRSLRQAQLANGVDRHSSTEIPVQIEPPKPTNPSALFRRAPSQADPVIEIPVEIEQPGRPAVSPQPTGQPTREKGTIALPPPPDLDAQTAQASGSLPVLAAGGPALPGQVSRRAKVRQTLPPAQTPSAANPEVNSAGRRYRVLVVTANPAQQAKIRSLVPDAFRSSYRGQSAMQVGSYEQRAEADNVLQLMSRNGFQPVIDISSGQPSVLGPGSNSGMALTPLPVPRVAIPPGSAETPTIYAAGSAVGSAEEPPPPPTPGILLGHRYRVVVPAPDSGQQAKVRALIPDAFRSSYQGRSVMQVGSFKSRNEADSVIQVMTQNGFQPVLVTVQ